MDAIFVAQNRFHGIEYFSTSISLKTLHQTDFGLVSHIYFAVFYFALLFSKIRNYIRVTL